MRSFEMDRTARITKKEHPLMRSGDQIQLMRDPNITLEEGTPVSIGWPFEARYEGDVHWVVPVLLEGKGERFFPQDSVQPD